MPHATKVNHLAGSTASALTTLSSPPAGAVEARHLGIAARDWRALDDSAIERWDELAREAGEPNPFYESWYLLPSLRLFDPNGEVELLWLEADGRLVGLLPLRRERRYYGHPLPHWRNWLHANMFLGSPLVAHGFEALFWREAFAWCDGNTGAGLFLHLAQVPVEGPLAQALVCVLGETRRPAATVMREERAMLRSTLSAEAYLEQSLGGKKRKELRRQHRRLGEEGELTVVRTCGAEDIEAWAEEFLALEESGWKGKAGSALACDFATRILFAEALEGAARGGRLERLAVRLDGKPLAMLASFLCPPGAFSYKTAFDEAFARFSPGVLLQCENLALLERPAIGWTDSCAAADHPMIDHIWRERRTIARHNVAIGGVARRLLFRALAARETGHSARGIQ
jgi:CelD/BcsL family acetyltransferase involved in cellulose biosynthesis